MKNNNNNNNNVEDREGERKAKANSMPAQNKNGPLTIILNLDLHCEGCAKKAQRSLKDFPGVDLVTTDINCHKLTVVGKVDPMKIRERVERKTHKKVMLVSPIPNTNQSKGNKEPNKEKDNTKAQGKNEKAKKNGLATPCQEDEGEDQNESDKKSKNKGKSTKGKVEKDNDTNEGKDTDKSDKKKPKEPMEEKPMVSTVVMKVGLHCEGCTKRIRKTIASFKGVETVAIDSIDELVVVRGTMDVKAMESYLKEKLKRSIDIIPPKKENNKKEKNEGTNNDDDNDDGKEKDGDKNDGGAKKKGGGKKKKGGENELEEINKGNIIMGASRVGYYNDGLFQNNYYGSEYGPYGHQMEMVHAPQAFSDENPNACFIM